MFTNTQLVEFCREVFEKKWVYWYGTCGYRCTESLYNSKRRQYPSHYTDSRKSGYMADIRAGKWCADCVGMIKAFFWSGGVCEGQSHYASNGCPDVSANGMIDLCRTTGPIGSIPDIPGLVVWKPGHIGVYIGGGYTIEMRGFAYDCVKRKVTAGPWTKWGKLPMLDYAGKEPEPVAPPALGDRILRNGDRGEDVREMQEGLVALGYDLGRYGVDGDFGDATEMAVKEFQRDHGLEPDGEFGPRSLAALNDALDAQKPGDMPRDVEIMGGNCYVRTAPKVEPDNILGVAMEGEKLPYQGEISENGWLLVIWRGVNAWVSGK